MRIYKATEKELSIVTDLAMRLWPDGERTERAQELLQLLADEEAAILLAQDGGEHAGFVQCQLRHDYVEGASGSPTGYLEGIYVEEKWRGSGLAARLLAAAEDWSRQMGCSEFASDCELENEASRRFHMKNGFEEAGRIICFLKKL